MYSTSTSANNLRLCLFFNIATMMKLVTTSNIPENIDYNLKFTMGNGKLYYGESASIVLTDRSSVIGNGTEISYVSAFAMSDIDQMTETDSGINGSKENITNMYSSLRKIIPFNASYDYQANTSNEFSKILANWTSVSSGGDMAHDKINLNGTEAEHFDSLYLNNANMSNILSKVNLANLTAADMGNTTKTLNENDTAIFDYLHANNENISSFTISETSINSIGNEKDLNEPFNSLYTTRSSFTTNWTLVSLTDIVDNGTKVNAFSQNSVDISNVTFDYIHETTSSILSLEVLLNSTLIDSANNIVDEVKVNDSVENITDAYTSMKDIIRLSSQYLTHENISSISPQISNNWTIDDFTSNETNSNLTYNTHGFKKFETDFVQNNDENCTISIPNNLNYRIDMKFSVVVNITKLSEVSYLFDQYLRHALDTRFCNSIVQVAFNFDDVYTYSWTNTSMKSYLCDFDNLHHLRTKIFNGSKISEELQKSFLPFFQLHDVILNYFQSCSSLEVEPYSNLLLLCSLCLIPSIILFMFFVYLYHRRSEKYLKNKNNILRSRQPLVFSNEIGIPPTKVDNQQGVPNKAYKETELT